jgi:hypothetical protein
MYRDGAQPCSLQQRSSSSAVRSAQPVAVAHSMRNAQLHRSAALHIAHREFFKRLGLSNEFRSRPLPSQVADRSRGEVEITHTDYPDVLQIQYLRVKTR